MTNKINFIISSAHVFNCTPTIVLAALSSDQRNRCRSVHPKTVRAIRARAVHATTFSTAEMRDFSRKILELSTCEALFNRWAGSKVQPLPLP